MRAVLVSPSEANSFSYGRRTGDLYVLCSTRRPLHNSYNYAKSVFGSANPVILTIWPDYPQYINADAVWATARLKEDSTKTEERLAAAVYYIRVLRAVQLSRYDVERVLVRTGAFCGEGTMPVLEELAGHYGLKISSGSTEEGKMIEADAIAKLRSCYSSIPSTPPYTYEKYSSWLESAAVPIKRMLTKTDLVN